MAEETVSVVDLDINLAEAEAPPELPVAKYRAEVIGVTDAVSGKGNPYWNIAFKIPPSEIPAEMAEFYEDGQTMYWNRQLKPNGKDRRIVVNLRKLYESLGLDTNVTQIDPNEWMGREVMLATRMGKDLDNNPRLEIARIEPVETRAAAPARGAATPAAKGKGRR